MSRNWSTQEIWSKSQIQIFENECWAMTDQNFQNHKAIGCPRKSYTIKSVYMIGWNFDISPNLMKSEVARSNVIWFPI